MADKKGKGVMDASELPDDIPAGFKRRLSWKDSRDNKNVLLKPADQGRVGACWTISVTRMNGAHLYIHNKTRRLLSFSSKHVFGNVKEKFGNGFLKTYKGLKMFLRDDGMILEEDCKCKMGKEGITTDACEKVKGRNVFKIRQLITVEDAKDIDEKEIIRLLNTRGPIVVKILVSDEYTVSKEDKIYFGVKKGQNATNHLVLVTGYDTIDGVNYFEFQNSWGPKWKGSGFGKFARKSSLSRGAPSLILEYMWPELLEEVFDV